MVHGQPGDRQGRRIARRRAALFGEARNVATALDALIKRAGLDAPECRDLVKQLMAQERIALQRSHGRVNPRKRYRGHSSHPVLEHRPVNFLYIDEGGKSKPEPLPGPTFFSIGSIAMTEDAANDYRRRADGIKRDFFGEETPGGITFHEPLMRHRKGPYYFDGNTDRQTQFDRAIDGLIAESEFIFFGVGIRKTAFQDDFVATGLDPYLPTDVYSVAIIMLLERYIDYLATSFEKVIGRITFESQGPKEDAEHQFEYAKLLLDGSQWVTESSFRNWLETGLRFTPKQGSDPMELADMASRDLYEWIRGGCIGDPRTWHLFCQKVYCRGDGNMGTFGVKVFPDSDIRHLIEEHRRKYGASTAASTN